MRNRRPVNPIGILKDYAVPLAWWFILLLIIYFWFFSGSSSSEPNHENQVGINVQLSSPTDEAYIVYTGDFKKKIEWQMSLYKGEKVVVKEGAVSLQYPSVAQFDVNKIWEFKYNEDATFSLYSSDVWIDSQAPVTVSMRYAVVNIWANSHVNLTQNEVGSTVYLLDGSAEVKNMGGKSTVLWKGQKIMIASIDTTRTDVDLSLEKDDIDDTFKGSDWYIRNNGDSYLLSSATGSMLWFTWSTWSTATGFTATGFSQINSSQLITIENLQDEQTVTDSSITINGSYTSDQIVNIKLNNQDAIIDKNERRFSFKDFPLDAASNDLVFKIYNSSNEILWKIPYTIYLKGWTTQSSKTPTFEVKNYSLDDTNFKFISPKTNPYTTSDDIVVIEWMVPAKTVSYIEINGFRLGKFVKNGTYWKYFANKQFGNLNDGLNIYEVQYHDDSGKLLYKNAFTIVKTANSKTGTSSTTWTGTSQ